MTNTKIMRQLLEVTKIQILKVIHNCNCGRTGGSAVVGSHKDTNFESNSQHRDLQYGWVYSCWKSQRYKF